MQFRCPEGPLYLGQNLQDMTVHEQRQKQLETNSHSSDHLQLAADMANARIRPEDMVILQMRLSMCHALPMPLPGTKTPKCQVKLPALKLTISIDSPMTLDTDYIFSCCSH